jgi:hypothetical protein
MKMAADGSAGLPDLTDDCSGKDLSIRTDIDLGQVGIQRKQIAIMFYDHKVAIEVSPGGIYWRLIGAGENDRPICCGMDRCAARVGELDAVMRLARPVGGGTEAIGWIDKVISGRLDGALQQEMPIGDTEIRSE